MRRYFSTVCRHCAFWLVLGIFCCAALRLIEQRDFEVAQVAFAQQKVNAKPAGKSGRTEDVRGTAGRDRASASRGADEGEAVTTVIAEGIGESADEALKDAFRHAVRQVVGVAVDAETLIKNEDVVDDKVLTYSDGFIKHYDEISKKASKSLHRVKIKAQVERRSVVAKLKAASVTVKEVDGAALFAEAVTQLEAEENVEALLRKAFAGFPQNVLTASEEGKPELTEKSADQATVRINVVVQPDMAAYKAFVGRLQPILEKVAKEKGEFGAVFKHSKDASGHPAPFLVLQPPFVPLEWVRERLPKAFEGREAKAGVATIALATQRSAKADRLECRYYLLDKTLQPLLAEVAFRSQSAKISLLGAKEDAIAIDRFPLSGAAPPFFTGNLPFSAGTLMAAIGNHFRGGVLDSSDDEQTAIAFWLAPVFLSNGGNVFLTQQPTSKYSRTFSLSLVELKAVQKVEIEVLSAD